MNSPITAFRCPSDTGSTTVGFTSIAGNTPTTTPLPIGRVTYFGVAGVDPIWSPANPTGATSGLGLLVNGVVQGAIGFYTDPSPPNGFSNLTVTIARFGGVFGANSVCGFRDMTDGSSNTIIVGERYTPSGSSAAAAVTGDGDWAGATSDITPLGQGNVLGEASIPINYLNNSTSPRPGTTGLPEASTRVAATS